ncbi:MAG TPA: DUF5693 family protein, partial [Syntrophomonas sp.]|nr:DUF5693 family protein [Syntrophomonas sp.]HRW12063.1 DUF5693 family protein [Syntrophomonas sp.]
MNNREHAFLWLALAVALLFSITGFWLRISNESMNNTLVTVADYQLFEKGAQSSSLSMDEVLADLKASGVKTIAVKETTLRGLAARGDAYVASFADFNNTVRTYQPDVWAIVKQLPDMEEISPANLVVSVESPETASFLQEKLGNRFTPDQIVNFPAGGRQYFIIKAELEALDKSKTNIREYDVQLGFETSILQKLKAMGFAIVLRPGDSNGSNRDYLQEYEPLVRAYDVKTLIFNYNRVSGSPDHLDVMARLIDKYDLTIGVIETSKQLGIIEQDGLNEVMSATKYPINRVYSTGNDDFVTSVDERYYRWIRGVVDRGIRILYVVPFNDDKKIASVNVSETIDTVARFLPAITAKGFVVDQTVLPYGLNSETTTAAHRLAISLSLLAALLLYLLYLWHPQRHWMRAIAILGLLACLAINIVLHMDFSKIYALAAAVLYPAFSSLLLLIYLKKYPRHGLMKKLWRSLAIILVINALGMYTIVSSLADIRFIMNLSYFSGVKVAFITPLLLFPLNYFCVTVPRENWLPWLRARLKESPSYLALALFMAALVVVYVYIGRSGNDSGIQVSSLEIRLREILENIFLARPRFKEFVIGYPALMAMVYLYHRYKNDLILLLLGFGVVIGSISMVNSFCHVFTAVSISASRTLAGLATGLLLGTMLVIAIWLAEKIWAKYGFD